MVSFVIVLAVVVVVEWFLIRCFHRLRVSNLQSQVRFERQENARLMSAADASSQQLNEMLSELAKEKAKTAAAERSVSDAKKMLTKAIAERDRARQTSTRQTALVDSIIERIDGSGTLANELSKGHE